MATLNRDGVSLHYEAAGEGPAVVLVHGWACDTQSMAPLFEHLRRDHRVVSVDLRGHGESDAPEQAYPVEGFADDVAWMCRALGLERVTLVGHSLGGSVAIETAARNPDLVTGVVILEGLVVPPPGAVEGFLPVLAGFEGPQWEAVGRGFVEQLLGPWYEPAAKAAFRDRMLSTPYHVLRAALRGSLEHDSAAAAARCKVPVLYVASGPWYTDVARFRALAPQLVTAQLVGCGHYFCTEVPEQVNPIVARYLKVFVDGA